jgi:RecB family exonuclease
MRRLEGRAEWRAGLERIRDEMDGESGKKWRRKGISETRLRSDLPRLLDFLDAVADLGDVRSEEGWIEFTLEVLGGQRFELRRRLCTPVGDRWDLVRLDQRGVEHVERLLREWRELVRSAEPMAVREWYERLRRLLEANELALSTPLKEGVQVLEAHEAALSPFPHMIVIHANDGVFPRTPSSMGVFSDEERFILRQGGLPLTDRVESMRRERTLWRAVTGGPDVTVTYRTTDANGVPRLPSLMVPDHDPSTELSRTLDLEAGAERAQGAMGLGPASPAQLRRSEALKLKAVRRAGRRGEFETAHPRHLQRAVLGAFADELRSGGLDDFVRREADLGAARGPEAGAPADPSRLFGIDRPISLRPNAWNGKIRDPEILAALERKYGDDYVWSPSQLETYGKRPFDFLLDRVLGLEEVAEADEETSALALGSVAHRILEGFYASILGSIPGSLDAAAAKRLDEVADRVIEEIEADQDQWLGLEPLWEVTRRDVRDLLRAYLEWELKHMAEKGERPIAVELQFGFGDRAPVELRGLDARGQQATLLLRGRIDRVDRHGEEEGGVLRILDYKTGLTSLPLQKGYEDGALLQTALYMVAVDSLGLGPVDRARYRGLRTPGKPANKYDLRYSRVEPTLRLALSIPGRVREGLFEAVQAASATIAPWQPGRAVTRSEARLDDGSRFDRLSE